MKLFTSKFLALGIFVAAIFAINATSALAGSYTITSCQSDPAGSSSGWTTNWTNETDAYAKNNGCAYSFSGTTGLESLSNNSGSEAVPSVGAVNSEWTFTSPKGTTIGQTYLWLNGEAQPTWTIFIADSSSNNNDDLIVGSNQLDDAFGCYNYDNVPQYPGCTLTGTDTSNPTTHPNLSGDNTNTFSVGVACGGSTTDSNATPTSSDEWTYCDPTSDPSTNGAYVSVYGAQITINDDNNPSVGSLTSPTSGYVASTQTFSTTESDPVGLESAVLLVDGNAVQSWSNSNCSFDQPVPCTDPGSVSFSFNTNNISNGAHKVAIAVTDSAGNTSTTYANNLYVSNVTPTAPVTNSLSFTPASWSDTSTANVSWANPTNDPAPIEDAFYTVNGGAPQEVAGNSINSLNLKSLPNGEDTICVWLEDQAGNVNSSNSKCGVVYIDYGFGTLGTASWNPNSGYITIPFSDISGLNPNQISISAKDLTTNTSVNLNVILQGGNIVGAFPVKDENNHKWAITINAKDNAGNQVEKSYALRLTNRYVGPKFMSVHYSKKDIRLSFIHGIVNVTKASASYKITDYYASVSSKKVENLSFIKAKEKTNVIITVTFSNGESVSQTVKETRGKLAKINANGWLVRTAQKAGTHAI